MFDKIFGLILILFIAFGIVLGFVYDNIFASEAENLTAKTLITIFGLGTIVFGILCGVRLLQRGKKSSPPPPDSNQPGPGIDQI